MLYSKLYIISPRLFEEKNMIYHDLLIVWWHCLDIKTWASRHPITLPAILERVWRPQRRWGIGNVWGNTLATTRRFRLDRFCFFRKVGVGNLSDFTKNSDLAFFWRDVGKDPDFNEDLLWDFLWEFVGFDGDLKIRIHCDLMKLSMVWWHFS